MKYIDELIDDSSFYLDVFDIGGWAWMTSYDIPYQYSKVEYCFEIFLDGPTD
jgi:hypothetical protein